MFSLTDRHRFLYYRPVCDLRKGFDGLCGLIQNELKLNPLQGDVFIFRNRRGDRIKILMWDKTGFLLYYKQLEKGTFEQPMADASSDSIRLTYHQLHCLLEGIDLGSVRHRKRYILPIKKDKKNILLGR